jgi:protein TonB
MRRLPWAIAFAFAISVHASLFYVAELGQDPAPQIGANAKGKDGLEIGLGMSGSYADIVKRTAPAETTTPEPEAVIKPKSITKTKTAAAPKPRPKTTPAPKPIVKSTAPIPPTRTTETAEHGYQAAEETTTQNIAVNASAPDTKQVANVADMPAKSDTASNEAMIRASGSGAQRSAGGKAGDSKHYFSQLSAWLGQHKTYPPALKKRKAQGIVTVKFGIRRNGEIFATSVKSSSGHKALDEAALQMLADASPLPPLPASIKKEQIHLVIPIEYSLITNDFHED